MSDTPHARYYLDSLREIADDGFKYEFMITPRSHGPLTDGTHPHRVTLVVRLFTPLALPRIVHCHQTSLDFFYLVNGTRGRNMMNSRQGLFAIQSGRH